MFVAFALHPMQLAVFQLYLHFARIRAIAGI